MGRDYRVVTELTPGPGIYLQGGTEHTHGITSSLLSNTAIRAAEILAGADGFAAPDPRSDEALNGLHSALRSLEEFDEEFDEDGDPLSAEFRFCGNSSNDASPYCQYHARIAFQPVSERRRAR